MSSAFRSLAVVACSGALTGCGLPYYLQAIGGQLELLRKREPIEAVIADPNRDAAVRATLSSIAGMREFAVNTLGLPDNDSYTTYVDLDRSYVVWNVVAAREFSVEPEQWCFPVAGCVTYRGFFEREAADRYRQGLEAEGFDTWTGGVRAYSTLGWFEDPVLNTMLDRDEEYIASMLFHELAHQKLYVADDSELSEAFATAVEEYGVALWLGERGAADVLERYRQRAERQDAFGQLVGAQRARLREIYSSPLPADAKRAAKAESFEVMQNEYQSLRARWDGADDYDAWFAQPLNNAALASVTTYRRWLPALRSQLQRVGLEAFYREMEAVAELPADEREPLLESWLESVSAAVRSP